MDIAVVIMVKNEENHILKTLEAARQHINTYVILDTGSTDQTVDQIRSWCAQYSKTLFLEQTTFVNFEKTRNELLQLAERAPEKWLLLLDASDEPRGTWENLAQISRANPPPDGALVKQHWHVRPADIIYKNCRFIRNRHNWQYKGVVHEYITRFDAETNIINCPDDFYLYQDRTKDGNKSAARFLEDYKVLKAAVNEEPNNERHLFYMGQTCRCLRKYEESCIYYRKYLDLTTTFMEERSEAQYNLGLGLIEIGCDKMALESFLNSYETYKRVEPLLEIAKYYRREGKFKLAYIFLSRACKLSIPANSILFFDKRKYDYERWYLMGIVSYYVGKKEEGKSAAKIALEAASTSEEREVNERNIKSYDAI